MHNFKPFDILSWREGDGAVDHDLVEAVWEHSQTANTSKGFYGCFFFRHPSLSNFVDPGIGLFCRPKVPPFLIGKTANTGDSDVESDRIRVLSPRSLSRVMRKLYRQGLAQYEMNGSVEEDGPIGLTQQRGHPPVTLGTWFAICERFLLNVLDADPVKTLEDHFGHNKYMMYPGTVFLTRKTLLQDNWKGGRIP